MRCHGLVVQLLAGEILTGVGAGLVWLGTRLLLMD